MDVQLGHYNQPLRYCETLSGLGWSEMNSEGNSVENICFDTACVNKITLKDLHAYVLRLTKHLTSWNLFLDHFEMSQSWLD